jgi:asparagine synthase (glutamine-hydrolysing)
LAEPIVPIVRGGPAGLGLELSGGIDSAVVATAVSQHVATPPTSFGLIVDAPGDTLQVDRRNEIVRGLSLRDISFRADDHLPFVSGGARALDRPHYADGDVYREAFDVLRSCARDAGVDVVFTGFGGDELMSLRSAERLHPRPMPDLPPWLSERSRDALAEIETNIAPTSPIAVPTLMAFAARNPAYLHFGLWPVAPLSSPDLLRFTESLPVEWRQHKTLLRRYLQQSRFSKNVTHPTTMESFDITMNSALRRHGPEMLSAMLDSSILVEQGFVDRRELARQYANLVAGEDGSPLLYDTLAVERGIQSMVAVGGAR